MRQQSAGFAKPWRRTPTSVSTLASVGRRGYAVGMADDRYAPGADEMEAMARAAIARLPEAFRRHLGDVVLRIEEFADDAILDEMGIEDPFDLTGLYTGRPLGEKSSLDSGALPDMIHLYRRPILEEWIETGVGLDALVSHVLVHEVGHHFGLSDDDMHALEAAAEADAAR